MMCGQVLLVSDDPNIGQIWAFALRQMGLEAVLATTAGEALGQWVEGAFDLIVIDVHGEQLDGLEVCRLLRAEAVNPILMFTPRGDESHVLEVYQAGADECVVKPVSPPMFLAKVGAWLRRSWTLPAGALDSLRAGDLHLDPARRVVTTGNGCTVKLTNLEFRLLHLLMSHPGQVLPSDLIIDRVWGYQAGGDSTLLKNVVYRLRRKIEPDPSQPQYIETVAGEGYAFQPV